MSSGELHPISLVAAHRQAHLIRGLVARLDDGHTSGVVTETVEARLARLERAMAAARAVQ